MTTASTPTVILWFRQDLRLADNPALDAAVKLEWLAGLPASLVILSAPLEAKP